MHRAHLVYISFGLSSGHIEHSVKRQLLTQRGVAIICPLLVVVMPNTVRVLHHISKFRHVYYTKLVETETFLGMHVGRRNRSEERRSVVHSVAQWIY